MNLIGISNRRRMFRMQRWRFEYGRPTNRGYAYIGPDGCVWYSSDRTAPYRYGRATEEDWYEIDSQGYPKAPTDIRRGGE